MKLNEYLGEPGRRAADLAKTLGVGQVQLSQWRTGARAVPAEHCPEIEKATHGAVTCEELRPDVDWGYLRNAAAREPVPSGSAACYRPCATHSERREYRRRKADVVLAIRASEQLVLPIGPSSDEA